MKDVSRGIHPADILDQINHAIDEKNMNEVEKQLALISERSPLPFTVEDSQLFAKRIIYYKKKGSNEMKKRSRKIAALAASFALVLCMGITVYASGLYKEFTFFNKDTTVIIKSDQDMSEEEAKELASEAAEAYNQPVDEAAIVVPVEEQSYTDLAAIKEAFGIDVIVPAYLPKEFVMDSEIYTQAVPGSSTNVYVSYTSQLDPETRFGITVIKSDLPEDSTSITVVDSVYKDTYTTPSGTKYTLLTEEAAIIAQTEINDIQYALIFVGVSEEEMHKVIDSADLESYKN